MIINTAMQIPAKGQAPFYGLVNAAYAEELSGLKELAFKGETFEFHQCENKMPDLGIMADIIQLVRKRKPEFILSIGGSDILCRFMWSVCSADYDQHGIFQNCDFLRRIPDGR